MNVRLRGWKERVHTLSCPECAARWEREKQRERMREVLYPVLTDEEIDDWADGEAPVMITEQLTGAGSATVPSRDTQNEAAT